MFIPNPYPFFRQSAITKDNISNSDKTFRPEMTATRVPVEKTGVSRALTKHAVSSIAFTSYYYNVEKAKYSTKYITRVYVMEIQKLKQHYICPCFFIYFQLKSVTTRAKISGSDKTCQPGTTVTHARVMLTEV